MSGRSRILYIYIYIYIYAYWKDVILYIPTLYNATLVEAEVLSLKLRSFLFSYPALKFS